MMNGQVGFALVAALVLNAFALDPMTHWIFRSIYAERLGFYVRPEHEAAS